MDQAAQLTNELDLSSYWVPFTANRQFKAAPRLFVGAEGVWFTSADGKRVLDGSAGMWCVNAGHGRSEITRAVERQLATLDYAPAFQMSHPLAFELANKLAALAPQGLDRIFYTNSGSESVDTALKIALAYHRVRGEGHRTRLIGRERAYHGVGFGGMSVGGIVANRRTFGPMLGGVDHLPHTHDLTRNAFSKGQPEHGAEFADALERLVGLHGDTIAAVIVEPVSGSTGVLVPPKGYLERLRKICDANGILLIFDEVITGYGRLGKAFASEYFGVTPDLMTTAKGLTNAAIPMGAVFVKREVHDAIVQGPEHIVELFHGYTYSGHPVACAAGLATLDIYKRERLFERVAALAPRFQEALHSLRGFPHVIDIRNLGLMGAVELQPRESAPGKRGYEVFLECLATGLYARTVGDIIAFSPPLTIAESEIDLAVEKLAAALRKVA
jgi:beta-alanine--pyruvate transaminase